MSNSIKFTIVVVCYNPGEKLKITLDSIYSQEYWNIDVIIKDGASVDGSLSALQEAGYFKGRVGESSRIFVGQDRGIYDAMNIAVKEIYADSYVIFMNCGDSFFNKQVLGKVADYIENKINNLNKADELNGIDNGENDFSSKKLEPYIFYGDQYNLLTETKVSSAPKLNEFTLFRNVPCHQVCFYDSRLFENRKDGGEAYNISYKVRADYEHFLYSVYEKMAKTEYIDVIVSNYEGGGFSETVENRRISAEEHRKITNYYMGNNARKYRMIMMLTGAGLRTKLAESKRFSGMYNRIKSIIYGLK